MSLKVKQVHIVGDGLGGCPGECFWRESPGSVSRTTSGLRADGVKDLVDDWGWKKLPGRRKSEGRRLMNYELGVFEDQKGREVGVAGARQQGANCQGARGCPLWVFVLGNGKRLPEGWLLTAWTHSPTIAESTWGSQEILFRLLMQPPPRPPPPSG